MSLVIQFNFKNLYINNNKFYNLASKTYSATLFNSPSINVEGPKKGLKAIAFNPNKSQYMTCSSFYTTRNGLSFAFWFKADPSSGTYSRIFDFGNGSAQDNIIVFMYEGNLGFDVFSGSEYKKTDTIPNATNTWMHIVWTLDSSSGWNIYLNGVLKKTYSDGFYPKAIMRSNQYIGKSNWNNDPYFNGLISDFRVYSTVITQEEITNIYNQSYENTADSGELLDDVPLNTGETQLYNEIFCDLYKTNKEFNQCTDCSFGEQIIYKQSTESSEEACLNACSNENRCTSYSYDFSKKNDNCSQYISFPDVRYKNVKNVNSGYNVSKFKYKFSDLTGKQKKNVALKCSDQYLNNIFLTEKNIDLVTCINQDDDNEGNFTKIDVDPKCLYEIYNSNGMNPPTVNRVNYVDNPVLKLSKGDEIIDNYLSTYQNFIEKQVANSNINNLLNISSNEDVNNIKIPESQSDNTGTSNIATTILNVGDSILNTINTNTDSNNNIVNAELNETFENLNNAVIINDKYFSNSKIFLMFILIILFIVLIYCLIVINDKKIKF